MKTNIVPSLISQVKNSRFTAFTLKYKLASAACLFALLAASGLSVYAAQQNNHFKLKEQQSTKQTKAKLAAAKAAAATAKAPAVQEPAKIAPNKASKPVPAPVQPAAGHFSTLPLGASLPSDAACAKLVKTAAETRPTNSTYNATAGVGANATYPRVTGNYTGTTDEILQWAACKWGLDEDIVRAQAAVESWWFQRLAGDFTSDSSVCVPGHKTLGADGKAGQCPESIGILQVRWQFHSAAFANNNATNSTAYNADYVYAFWRDCYDGNMTWLNDVEKGSIYTAGDLWGCLGVWYAGRWHTADANQYIAKVQNTLNARVWQTADFKAAS